MRNEMQLIYIYTSMGCMYDEITWDVNMRITYVSQTVKVRN